MARYRGPRERISRRFHEPLFGHSKALERKNYGPGQHGKNRKKKKKYERKDRQAEHEEKNNKSAVITDTKAVSGAD